MNTSLQPLLDKLLAREDCPVSDAQRAFAAVLDGECSPVEMAALLTALRVKGESVEEIAGAAQAMLDRVTIVPTNRVGLLDTCGTGGDGLHTFNISTATAIVAAAAGIPVAKHGNRSVSSTSGSADVLEALGVNVQLTPEQVGQCIEEIGIGFCFAPLLHGAMKHVMPVRRELVFRTIFNLLGPLTNPANADFQLLGAGDRRTAGRLASALALLERASGLVVCGADQIDEVSLWGETAVFEVKEGTVREYSWTAESFGLPECSPDELRVQSAQESAQVIQGIADGSVTGPNRNIVVANAAAALVAANNCSDVSSAVEVASAAVDSGRVRQVLDRLVEYTNQ